MDWVGFLNDNQIEYVTRGPNTARDHVSIRCPWCQEDDPSQHLGISLRGEGWGCLRNGAHRGTSPSRLIAAALGCSYAEAKIIEAQYSKADPDALLALESTLTPLNSLQGHEEVPDFWHITRTGSSAKFWTYLKNRGFDDPKEAIEQYHLKCCLMGRFKDRLIIPFYRDHQLIAWTGRAIGRVLQAPRYLSSKLVKTTIFNEDELMKGGNQLFIVEGPFDALKLDFYGQQYGARATCVFGTALSMDQVVILSALSKRFQRLVILFDADAVEPSWEAAHWLNAQIGSLPDGVKDPGELREDQIQYLAKSA